MNRSKLYQEKSKKKVGKIEILLKGQKVLRSLQIVVYKVMEILFSVRILFLIRIF